MKSSISLIKLIIPCLFLNFIFTQKLSIKSKLFEIDDLNIEKTVKTSSGTYGRLSKVQKYKYNEKYEVHTGNPEQIALSYLKRNFSPTDDKHTQRGKETEKANPFQTSNGLSSRE